MGYIHPVVSEIYDPQSLDPICGKFDKFLAHGQAHMGQMGKWPWQCTTRGLDNSTELWMEKSRQPVTEIWVPQVWQPSARTVTTIPLQPGGLRGKKVWQTDGQTENTICRAAWSQLKKSMPLYGCSYIDVHFWLPRRHRITSRANSEDLCALKISVQWPLYQ